MKSIIYSSSIIILYFSLQGFSKADVIHVQPLVMYKCSGISESQAWYYFKRGHPYLDSNRNGIPCDEIKKQDDKNKNKNKFQCKQLDQKHAWYYFKRGHPYLDSNRNGVPCDEKVTKK